MKRNVLMIIADDWSPLAGCYGTSWLSTPNIDRLAAEGVLFTRAYCSSPSCAASRASLLTGMHSHAHRQYGHSHPPHNFRVDKAVPTLPQILREAGVRVASLGKRHCGPESAFPWHQKGEEIDGQYPGRLCAQARQFLHESRGEPFYLQVASYLPHRMAHGFDDPSYHGFPLHSYAPEAVELPSFLPDTPEVRQEFAEYCSAITRFDHLVGLLLHELEASGRKEETLIVVMSDHGMPFPGAKASPFDAGHRCPLIVRMPGDIAPGRSTAATVSWVDYLPTVLDWFGLAPLPNFQGRSFLPVVGGIAEEAEWEETFLSHTFHEVTNYYPYRIVLSGSWKYVRVILPGLLLPLPGDLMESAHWRHVLKEGAPYSGTRPVKELLQLPGELLFDLEADPGERVNRVEDPACAAVLHQLRERMRACQTATGDPWLPALEQQERNAALLERIERCEK